MKIKFRHTVYLFLFDLFICYILLLNGFARANHTAWDNPLSTDGSVFYIFIMMFILIGLNVLLLLRLKDKGRPPIKEELEDQVGDDENKRND